MLNPEGSHPEHFRELCALAAGGLISETEFVRTPGTHAGLCLLPVYVC